MRIETRQSTFGGSLKKIKAISSFHLKESRLYKMLTYFYQHTQLISVFHGHRVDPIGNGVQTGRRPAARTK